MEIVDCLGEICPIPFLIFNKKLKESKEFTIVVDHSCAKEKIETYCKNNNINFFTNEPFNGIWEITINH